MVIKSFLSNFYQICHDRQEDGMNNPFFSKDTFISGATCSIQRQKICMANNNSNEKNERLNQVSFVIPIIYLSFPRQKISKKVNKQIILKRLLADPLFKTTTRKKKEDKTIRRERFKSESHVHVQHTSCLPQHARCCKPLTHTLGEILLSPMNSTL